MIYRLADDVVSNKRSKSTKVGEGIISYAKTGSFAKIISNHGDVVICESYQKLPKLEGDDEGVYVSSGNKFSTKLSNLRKVK